jgi:hypothetical protein
MNGKPLTEWSDAYVNALFKSELAREHRIGRFRQRFEREAFIAELATRSMAGVEVELFRDGVGLRIKGAGPDNLLELVSLARRCGGGIVFPGVLCSLHRQYAT